MQGIFWIDISYFMTQCYAYIYFKTFGFRNTTFKILKYMMGKTEMFYHAHAIALQLWTSHAIHMMSLLFKEAFKHYVIELLVKACCLSEMKSAFTYAFLLQYWCLSVGVLRGVSDWVGGRLWTHF